MWGGGWVDEWKHRQENRPSDRPTGRGEGRERGGRSTHHHLGDAEVGVLLDVLGGDEGEAARRAQVHRHVQGGVVLGLLVVVLVVLGGWGGEGRVD